ncbi:MAG: hypothetical protein Q4A06_10740 [Cardiobacteriaceae bacterium]|nr:hypothetical protein [Cardiobacteriaceae bacterium]
MCRDLLIWLTKKLNGAARIFLEEIREDNVATFTEAELSTVADLVNGRELLIPLQHGTTITEKKERRENGGMDGTRTRASLRDRQPWIFKSNQPNYHSAAIDNANKKREKEKNGGMDGTRTRAPLCDRQP